MPQNNTTGPPKLIYLLLFIVPVLVLHPLIIIHKLNLIYYTKQFSDSELLITCMYIILAIAKHYFNRCTSIIFFLCTT